MSKGEPTPAFFYYTGFEKDDMPPQPIWIDTEGPGTPCSFSIGMQYNPDPKASGWCEIPEWQQVMTDFSTEPVPMPLNMKMGFYEGPELMMQNTKDFGAGD